MAYEEKIFDFIVKQYEEHHQALLRDVQEERGMERNVVLACGVFYSWLATHATDSKTFLLITSLVPVAIVFLSTLRANAITNGVRIKADYLRKLEDFIYTNAPANYDGPKGWENYILHRNSYGAKYDKSQTNFWYFLLALTILAALFFQWIKK